MHRFQRVAAQRAETHHRQVVQEVEVQGVQLDEAHSKLRPKQVEWVHTALAMGSWFLLWVDFGPRTQDTGSHADRAGCRAYPAAPALAHRWMEGLYGGVAAGQTPQTSPKISLLSRDSEQRKSPAGIPTLPCTPSGLGPD